MAHSLSAAKRWRASIRRRERNRPIRSVTRTYVSKATALIAQGSPQEEATAALQQAVRALDKAAQKGVIHPNNAARRKSRLIKKYQAFLAPAPAEEKKEEPPKRRRRAPAKAAKTTKAAKARKTTTRTTKAATRTTKGTARTTKGTTRSRKSE